ncbi:MAG: DUF3135 domain-containing protein [Gammaproteobacteria bacterium]
MKSAYDWDIDFDAWSALAAHDPRRFEQQRSALIKEVMTLVPAQRQQRVRGLQWRIDQIRETSPNPLAGCIKLSQMMHDAVLGKDGLQERLRLLAGNSPTPQACTQPTATVLHFRRPAG